MNHCSGTADRHRCILSSYIVLNQAIKINMDKISSAFRMRLRLGIYIYSYMLKNALDGGSFIRPVFFDFKPSPNFLEKVMNLNGQHMMGSNVMAAPVVESAQRQKKVYFPDNIFYDFFTGTKMNSKEEWVDVETKLDTIPIYLRAGFVAQYQTPTDDIQNIVAMRTLPLEVAIGLDQFYRSYGRIYLDDGISSDSIKNRLHYRMDITSAQVELEDASNPSNPPIKQVHLIFKIIDKNFLPSNNEFPGISRIKIYGYNADSVYKISKLKISDDGTKTENDVSKLAYSFKSNLSILTINFTENLFSLTEDTTLIIT